MEATIQNLLTLKTRLLNQHKLIKILLGTAFIFFTAQIQIPIQPVPITLQTVSILIISLTYERSQALASILLYITLGVIGIPVFAGFASGIANIAGPRGGYLAGFVVCGWIISTLRLKYGDNNIKIFLYSILGLSGLYFCGVIWLSKFTGLDQAINLGFKPYIITGIIKSVLTVTLLQTVKVHKA